MDFIGTKTIYIGAAIFITLAITTAVLITFNQITQIYSKVYKTDVGIKEEFHEFTMYQNTEMTGLEMYNTVRKFKNDLSVNIYLNSNILNKNSYIDSFNINDQSHCSSKYFVSYVDNGNDTYNIIFK